MSSLLNKQKQKGQNSVKKKGVATAHQAMLAWPRKRPQRKMKNKKREKKQETKTKRTKQTEKNIQIYNYNTFLATLK